MLEIHDEDRGCTRRRLLSIGSLALGGLSLPLLFSARAAGGTKDKAAQAGGGLASGKSVIFLFQQGGPSQFETFDPKPEAPSGIRTITGVTQTSLPGAIFGETFGQIATHADKLTIVRSFHTGNANHNIHPLVCKETLGANLGSLYSRVAGPTHPRTAMPTSAVLFPQAVSSEVPKGQGRGDLAATGSLSSVHAPFIPGGAGQLLRNLRLNLAVDRFQERQALRAQLDQLGRQFDSDAAFASLDENQRQACEVLLSGSVANALDLSREDASLVERYDTSRFAVDHGWRKADRGRRGYYNGQARSLGKALLLARRLCEAGCGFVTVHCDYEGLWDMHADQSNLNITDGMHAVGRPFDHAVSAFIEDVEARGLSDRILLIATGEMGRTPRINRTGGRDHWARLAPLMLYGGGFSRGRIIGQSTRDGGEPLSNGYGTVNLISTVLHTMLDVGRLRLDPSLGTIARLAEPEPIPGLA